MVFEHPVRNIYKINFNTRYRNRIFRRFFNKCAERQLLGKKYGRFRVNKNKTNQEKRNKAFKKRKMERIKRRAEMRKS